MFLRDERAALTRLAPGLDDRLAAHPLTELERPDGPALPAYRLARAPGLLVPVEHGGSGAGAVDAVLATRALGARAPSLAVAATMHNFSVASLVALATHSTGFEWMLLDAIARDRLLVASAFAEGRPGQGVFSPSMTARRVEGGWRVTGSKKPCSLSRSADIVTTSVALPRDDGGTELGVALIPARSPGISVRPFWGAGVLTGAESDELVLDDVAVDDRLMVRPDLEPGSALDDLNRVGLIWFTLLITAAYLGIASALVERALRPDPSAAATRAALVGRAERATLAVRSVAATVDAGDTGPDVLARALMTRYATQDDLSGIVDSAVETLGGMAFVAAPDVALLAGACRALPFHPPARRRTAAALDRHLAGEPLVIA